MLSSKETPRSWESVVKRDLNNAFRRFWLTGSILALLALAVGLVLEIGVWQRTVAGATLVCLLISFGLAMRTNRARALRSMQALGEWLLNGYIVGGWAIAGLVALYAGTIVWGIAVPCQRPPSFACCPQPTESGMRRCFWRTGCSRLQL